MSEKKEQMLLVAWLVVNLVIGLWIVQDYGLSYDEPDFYRYADYSLDAYKSFFGQLFEPDYGFGNLQYYGPAFILIVNSIVKILYWIRVDISEIHVWHYAYFVAFQLTSLCLYGLAKRWFTHWTAWAILVLFISQPILWGHSFINPKDIPFMFFFTFSIWSGYRLVDSFERTAVSVTI
jgi:4-amino-4-deoxy-L-arabinose transferase-like glycosyltransferase